MGKKLKQQLSLCLSAAVTAAALPLNSIAYAVDFSGADITMSAKKAALAFRAEDMIDLPDEIFAALTLSDDNGELIADGNAKGQSFAGFSLNENNDITVEVDGMELSLQEAEDVIGCTVSENADGDTVITSPFQSARIIVKSEKDFDCLGALTVEERAKDIYLLTFASPSEAYEAFNKLQEDENIIYAEPDVIVAATAESKPDFVEYGPDNLITAWGTKTIHADEFCEKLRNENDELPEVKVAVIDTGIYYEHNQFKGRILEGGKSFAQEDIDDIPDDNQSHGTHCAGIICSSTNDNVKILPVQALNDSGAGSAIDLYSAMIYSVDQGADILSISIEFYGKVHAFEEAIDYADDHGVIICVAAGNSSFDITEQYCALAVNPKTVAVTSVNPALEFSQFSNYGAVDFAAPGEQITSAGLGDVNATSVQMGTSMACPYVAACFADVLSYDKNLTRDEAYDILKLNAVDLFEEGYDPKSGWGLINLGGFHTSGEKVDLPEADKNSGAYDEAVSV